MHYIQIAYFRQCHIPTFMQALQLQGKLGLTPYLDHSIQALLRREHEELLRADSSRIRHCNFHSQPSDNSAFHHWRDIRWLPQSGVQETLHLQGSLSHARELQLLCEGKSATCMLLPAQYLGLMNKFSPWRPTSSQHFWVSCCIQILDLGVWNVSCRIDLSAGCKCSKSWGISAADC